MRRSECRVVHRIISIVLHRSLLDTLYSFSFAFDDVMISTLER